MSNTASDSRRQLRVCRIVTVPLTFATLLREQINGIVDVGIDLTLVSSPGPELDELSRVLPVHCRSISMTRKFSPREDLCSLLALVRFLHRGKFDIVHSSTPKAGLLSALAGVVARVPARLHTYTGQVWIDLRGPIRWIAYHCDQIIGRLSTHCYADSESQRNYLVSQQMVDARKIRVLGAGSISGVDLQRFDPSIVSRTRANLRRRSGIAETSLVIIFVGRVTKDKGIVELISAFRMLRELYNDIDLVLVGPLESERDPLPPETLEELSSDMHIHAVGFTVKPEEYLAMADIFCLPSYREGFGTVAIEAGAMSLPAVVTRVTGLVDAVVDGETGVLVPPRNVEALTQALQSMIESPEMRYRMGQAARQRAVRYFDAATINQMVVDEYFRLANKLKVSKAGTAGV